MNLAYRKAIDEFIDEHCVIAKRELNSLGTINPQIVFFFYYPNDEKKFGQVFIPDAQDFLFNPHGILIGEFVSMAFDIYVERVLPEMGADFYVELVAVIFIMDAWTGTISKSHSELPLEMITPPSQRSDRGESLCYQVHAGQTVFVYNFPYKREKEGIVFEHKSMVSIPFVKGEHLYPKDANQKLKLAIDKLNPKT